LLLLLFIAARESYPVLRQEDVHENIESSIWRILLHGTRLVALSCRFDILLSSCMLPAYFGVNLYRSFQFVSSVPRGTSARPLQSFARNNPLSLPSPFCIRFVSVFFHPKLNVCKQDLWCLKWPHAITRIQQSVGFDKILMAILQNGSSTIILWDRIFLAYLLVCPLQKLHSIALKWRRMTCLSILRVA
jgi:hypothetical protein